MNLNDYLIKLDQSVPLQWRIPIELALILWPSITRGLHALYYGRGLKGALCGILFGTNTPATAPELPRAKIAVPLMLILVTLGLSVPLLNGCASAEKAAYQATSATAVTVDAAMTAYGDYLKANPGALTDAQRAQVRAAYIRYQNCLVEVIDAEEVVIASTSTNGSGTNSVTANAQTAALAAASQALTDLVTLLQSFGVKI